MQQSLTVNKQQQKSANNNQQKGLKSAFRDKMDTFLHLVI